MGDESVEKATFGESADTWAENAVSENAVSENAVSENAVSENAVSENAVVDVEEAEEESDLVRSLVIATHMHDREERARCTAALDEREWSEAALLLAAAKEVAIERHRSALDSEDTEVWLRRTAGEIVEQHRDWMRLVPGQVMTMLRSALGKHELALMVKRSVRGRLDATCVQHLIAMSMDYRDVFNDEVDDVLKEAAVVASRPVFAQEFAEG